ncbi:hypothetical protein DFH06DRAFT_1293861 [Mycena polygramma]|nr:hypothetical protein DFH06DRAFT_1293861 [Mycena polygramma]
MAAGDSTKADQIVSHVYTKLFHVLYAARASDQGAQGKIDKWFNLEAPIAAPVDTPTAELDAYRALSSLPPPAPFAIQVLLVVPPPGGGTALVHKPSGTRIEPEPRYVLLEEWVLGFTPGASSTASLTSTSSAASDTSADEDVDVLPSTIYKNAIPLFRALCAAAHSACVARPGMGAVQGGKRGLRVVVRLWPEGEPQTTVPGSVRGGGMGGIRNGWSGNGETVLGFGQSPSSETGAAPLSTSSHVFPGIAHPAGLLIFTAIYPRKYLSLGFSKIKVAAFHVVVVVVSFFLPFCGCTYTTSSENPWREKSEHI